ncbi:MAG: hypothetical protein WDO73_28480 [Ignavibacteriota bacterium]
MQPLGVYQTFAQAANFINGKYRYTNLEFFVQDTWKVTSRLTLDYGLRVRGCSRSTIPPCRRPPSCLRIGLPARRPRLYQPQMVNGVRSAVDPVTGQVLPAAQIGYIVPAREVSRTASCSLVSMANPSICKIAPPRSGDRVLALHGT